MITIDDALDIAIFGDEQTGIDHVMVWIGIILSDKTWKPYVLISNKPNELSFQDCFVVEHSSLSVIGQVEKTFIDEKKLTQILQWIDNNRPALDYYAQHTGMGSDEFLSMLR